MPDDGATSATARHGDGSGTATAANDCRVVPGADRCVEGSTKYSPASGNTYTCEEREVP